MTWIYQAAVLDQLPEDCTGFVYLIVNNISGRKYIGKKLARFAKTTYKTVTLKNGKKKKKKIKGSIESDWKDYWSSCDELKKDVELLGKDNFTREILFICYSKAECSYIEAKLQFENKVLESTDYYNNFIGLRVHGSHIIKSKILNSGTP